VLENEIDIVEQLIQRKIQMKEYEFKENKLMNIEKELDILVSSNPALESMAINAYKSYIFVSDIFYF
jgi:hypothetical protein